VSSMATTTKIAITKTSTFAALSVDRSSRSFALFKDSLNWAFHSNRLNNRSVDRLNLLFNNGHGLTNDSLNVRLNDGLFNGVRHFLGNSVDNRDRISGNNGL